MRIQDDHQSEGGSWFDTGPLDGSFDGKIVVLGVGNPYMRDDGVGIQVVHDLPSRGVGEEIVVQESRALEASLVWQFRHAAALVIVDALVSGALAGTISRFSVTPRAGPVEGIPSLHELQLHDLVDLSGLDMVSFPLIIVAIEPKDCSLGEGLTEELRAAVPRAVDEVVKVLQELSSRKAKES